LPGFKVTDGAISAGLQNIEWPARLERIRRGRLRGILGHDFVLWLDGGHNPGAADALAAWLADRDPMPVHLVFGMLSTKDPEAFLRILAPYIVTVHTVPIAGQDASADAGELAKIAQKLGLHAKAMPDVRAALTDIKQTEIGPARVLIAGSLYLAGLVLAENG
jgi:dihydrofolate synthase/folylpolyglutamate synthase